MEGKQYKRLNNNFSQCFIAKEDAPFLYKKDLIFLPFERKDQFVFFDNYVLKRILILRARILCNNFLYSFCINVAL